MKLLLDTHLLLWVANEPKRLPKTARVQIENPENELLFSAASIWEITIKRSLGRDDFDVDPRVLRRFVAGQWIYRVTHHQRTRDQCRRATFRTQGPVRSHLVAQATVEGITLLTNDRKLTEYPGPVRLVGRA